MLVRELNSSHVIHNINVKPSKHKRIEFGHIGYISQTEKEKCLEIFTAVGRI